MPDLHPRPTLLSLESAFPSLKVTQKEMSESLSTGWFQSVPQVSHIMERSRVQHRRMAVSPRELMARERLGVGERMALHEHAVVEVATRSAEAALSTHDRERIGSLIMACSTGAISPTPDLLLARNLQLRPSLRRTFVANMASGAGLNALSVALDGLAARPADRVLVNCTEIHSVHLRNEPTREQAVIHSLFGDASISLVLGLEEPGAGPQVLRSLSRQLYDAHELISWKLLDDGFRMTLSPAVPALVGEHIESFIGALLGPERLGVQDIQHWALHPGGPKIVEQLAQKLRLSDSQLRATWSILGEYGNCSSATVLLVLEELLAQDRPRPGEYGVLFSCGPGMTMEGALLRF
ncbi:MAG: type III polyketide synthase [Hyalangium sp.]|uniref:type III polyketide synthase n=1 Tax=Hyalangium sp. TaxID=2028555 RepID=UPI00389B1548